MKLPMAGIVRIAVPASQIHNETTLEFIFDAGKALVDRRRDAAEDDRCGRDHQRGEQEGQRNAAEQQCRRKNLDMDEREQQPDLIEQAVDHAEERNADIVPVPFHAAAQLTRAVRP